MDFVGLKALATDVPHVELEPAFGGVVDLYNDFDLCSVSIDADGLAFNFRTSESRLLYGARLVVLRFRDVRNLRVEQPVDWAPGESRQIEHLLIRGIGPWPRALFKAGGMEFEFDCGAVLLEVTIP